MNGLPLIPDTAFKDALDRLEAFAELPTQENPDDPAGPVMNFWRSLGIDAADERLEAVFGVMLGKLDPAELSLAGAFRLGAMTGLLLAQGSDWQPPIPSHDEEEDGDHRDDP